MPGARSECSGLEHVEEEGQLNGEAAAVRIISWVVLLAEHLKKQPTPTRNTKTANAQGGRERGKGRERQNEWYQRNN